LQENALRALGCNVFADVVALRESASVALGYNASADVAVAAIVRCRKLWDESCERSETFDDCVSCNFLF
jgi:hypothetical protein